MPLFRRRISNETKPFIVVNCFALLVYRNAADGRARLGVALLVLALLVQVSLGISTLLLHVPVSIAAAHQGGAVLLLSATLFISHVLVRQQEKVQQGLGRS